MLFNLFIFRVFSKEYGIKDWKASEFAFGDGVYGISHHPIPYRKKQGPCEHFPTDGNQPPTDVEDYPDDDADIPEIGIL